MDNVKQNPSVEVGAKVLAFDIPLYPQYAGRIATVTAISGGGDTLHGEFQSIEKPDDTINLAFTRWCEPFTRENLVGTRVKAVRVQGYERVQGQEITVDTVHHGTRTDWTNGFAVEGQFDDNGQSRPLWAIEWEPVMALVGPGDTPEVTALRAEIARLESRANDREATIARLQESVSVAHRAFGVASGILIREANDRGWCEAYDNIIDEINGAMPGPYQFDEREAEYEVEVEIEATVRYTTTVSVTARSQEAAEENVSDDMDSYVDAEEVIRDNLSYADLTIDSVEVSS
jgi:predicted SpoU family rRNA methylase